MHLLLRGMLYDFQRALKVEAMRLLRVHNSLSDLKRHGRGVLTLLSLASVESVRGKLILPQETYLLGEGITGYVPETGVAWRVEEAHAHPQYNTKLDRDWTGQNCKNLACVLVRMEDSDGVFPSCRHSTRWTDQPSLRRMRS
mmetsp:Transcript_13661/g.21340  ORF Transcript_13661/g.21340 Transcript_13661/m.21340 type:complete len:142 (-) Transcript_13661:334-759(-)